MIHIHIAPGEPSPSHPLLLPLCASRWRSSARAAAAAEPLRGQNQPVAPYPRGDTPSHTSDHPEPEKGAVRRWPALLDVDEAIIDGEVIVVDATGRPQFYDLVRRTRAPAYVAFDILWLDSADLRSLPLSERRRRLQGILPKGSAIVSEALSVACRGRELFELMRGT